MNNPIPTPTYKPAPRGHVLIVDDEEPNRTLLRDPLEAHGYQVREAENGEQALAAATTHPTDVVLLDLMMPGMDGFEVCRRLKADARTAPIPVLMVTALAERKERMMSVAAGANDFLNKPVDLQDLTLRVRNAVQSKHLVDQLQAEQENTQRLLLSILPAEIAERMKKGEANIADHHPDVTVLVADLVGFTALSAQIGAQQMVCLLNEIFSAFDLLAERHGVEKIKTIGDAYMAAGGLEGERPESPGAVAELALDMTEELQRFNGQYNTSLRLRIGINTGAVVAGVIGKHRLAYELWGDTVNLACRLESLGYPGSIWVAAATCERLKDTYHLERTRLLDGARGSDLIAYRLLGRRHARATANPQPRTPVTDIRAAAGKM